MIANTRKMYELKLKLQAMFEKEYYINDTFGALVAGNLMTMERLEEFIKISECPEIKNKLEYINKEAIMANPYLRDITIPNVQVNNIKLSKKRIVRANNISSYREKTRDINNFNAINSYYICNQTLHFPGIVEGETNVTWMTIEPSEIVSFEPFINEAKGNILLCGCGLGYVAYMLSLKSDVESIDIVELNEDVIQIFEEYILPQFKNKDKIKVIQSDAIEYLQNNDLSHYDYVNVDIWRDTVDMIYLYLPCLEVEYRYPDVKFSYWLETELKACLQKSILQYVADIPGDQPFYIDIAQSIVDNININNREDVKQCITLDDHRRVLYNWYMNNLEHFDDLKKQSEDYVKSLMKMSKQILKKRKEKNNDNILY